MVGAREKKRSSYANEPKETLRRRGGRMEKKTKGRETLRGICKSQRRGGTKDYPRREGGDGEDKKREVWIDGCMVRQMER